MADFQKITNCKIDPSAKIYNFVDLYGCTIGKNTKVDSFTYIEGGVEIGDDCKIRTHVFIPTGVKIGNRVFIASGVKFTNDKHPKVSGKSKLEGIVVEDDVAIGANATILPGVRIGKGSLIAAGATVTHDVPPGSLVVTHADNIVKEYERKP
jgi:UDP-2-acetamido-3-amino-2,3-dideoxy-glucuronate N-acetyltransferase